MNDVPFYYFAYGSNLPFLRMLERTSTDTIRKGKFEWRGQRLDFVKKSTDGSAKCTAIATSDDHAVWGVIYQVTYADKLKLIGCEIGYHEMPIPLPVDGEQKLGFTFIANPDQIDKWLYPYTWYKRLVLAGAREHDFPPAYIAQIDGVQARPDPNMHRSAQYEPLLSQIESALGSQAVIDRFPGTAGCSPKQLPVRGTQ
jgi:gamma-glutamylcyclotransferase